MSLHYRLIFNKDELTFPSKQELINHGHNVYFQVIVSMEGYISNQADSP